MTKPFKIIRWCDPAIDDPMGPLAIKYAGHTGTRDEADIPGLLREGAVPVYYIARTLTLTERRFVRNCASETDQYEAAFRRGLVRVDHPEKPWTRPVDHKGVELLIADKYLEPETGIFDEATVQEIGMVIRNRSFLEHTSGQSYPLPATSLLALQASLLLRVAQTVASSNSDATKPPASAPPPATTTPSPDGDASTGATVTG